MRILMTGATGLIGSALGRELAAAGHEIVVLARDPLGARSRLPFPCVIHEWASATDPVPEAALAGIEGVVHLAGEPIADGRWSEARKRRIRDSRVAGTRGLVAALSALETRLRVFVGGSAIGFYGDRGDELLAEDAAPGAGFLAGVCVDWERAADRLRVAGTRVVHVRTGIALAADGGALAKMRLIFARGLGGRIASGSQWMSWVHLEDLVRLFRFALENERVEGAVNGVAPEPVTNARFSRELARALGTFAVLPVPGILLKAALGELAGVLLGGARVSSAKVESLGFRFRHPELGPALEDLLAGRL